jgi:hypothetical protein
VPPSTDVSSAVKIFGVAAAVVLAAACSSSSPKAEPPTTTTAAPTSPATFPAGQLSARIELPATTLVAGSTERGTLVVENDTGGPVRLTTGGAVPCKPGWTVILTNEQLRQEAAFTTICVPRPMTVPVGETRLPFTLLSEYQSCSETGHAPDALTPPCVKDANGLDTSPPLPPGEYRATFFSDISRFIPVESVPVRVVEAG